MNILAWNFIVRFRGSLLEFVCFIFIFIFRRQRVSERDLSEKFRKDEMKIAISLSTSHLYVCNIYNISLFILAKQAGIPFLVPKIHSILYFHFKLALKNKVCACVRVCVPLVAHSQNLVKRNVIHDRRVYDNERKRLNVHNIFDGRDKIKRY